MLSCRCVGQKTSPLTFFVGGNGWNLIFSRAEGLQPGKRRGRRFWGASPSNRNPCAASSLSCDAPAWPCMRGAEEGCSRDPLGLGLVSSPPRAGKGLIFPAVFTSWAEILPRSPRVLVGNGREEPCARCAVVPCEEAETSLFAPLGSPNPTLWASDPHTHVLSLDGGKDTPQKAAFPPGWLVKPEPVCKGTGRTG